MRCTKRTTVSTSYCSALTNVTLYWSPVYECIRFCRMFSDRRKFKMPLFFYQMVLPKNLIKSCSYMCSVNLLYSPFCLDTEFLKIQSRTSWNHIQVYLLWFFLFLLPRWCRAPFFCYLPWFKSPLQHFQKQGKPCIHTAFFVVVVMDESHQALSQKTQTEILSALVCLREHAIHHAVLWSQVMNDNLPTCDRAVDSAENDLEMLNIFSFPPLSFFKLVTWKQGIHLQCWYSALKIKVLSFVSFFQLLVFTLSIQRRKASVLDVRVKNMNRIVCIMLCTRQYCEKINLFTFNLLSCIHNLSKNSDTKCKNEVKHNLLSCRFDTAPVFARGVTQYWLWYNLQK